MNWRKEEHTTRESENELEKMNWRKEEHTTKRICSENELEKRKAYDERIREVEHGSFSPLVFSTAGGMGATANVVYTRIASLIAEKHGKPYSKTINWLRCRLSFSLLRSAIICL
ncbi:Angiopoietin-related 3 [Paramuricea clavata]|uniref:Angiopoietin-related 3 n=1 Tax=Paramuricea clavata TaxID=317549 RepID=A0A7D9L6D3_PARCT|nr:Angiopoietin-related 3 [Paramuricea clavata]